MSALTEQVGREHHPTTPIQCSCGWRGSDTVAEHIAEVTEDAARAQVAADIRAKARQEELLGRMAGQFYDAADIAEGTDR